MRNERSVGTNIATNQYHQRVFPEIFLKKCPFGAGFRRLVRSGVLWMHGKNLQNRPEGYKTAAKPVDSFLSHRRRVGIEVGIVRGLVRKKILGCICGCRVFRLLGQPAQPGFGKQARSQQFRNVFLLHPLNPVLLNFRLGLNGYVVKNHK